MAARHDPRMRCITPWSHDGHSGWTVGLVRQGKRYQKGFSFNVYGGEEAALLKAQQWRDEIAALHPAQTRLAKARFVRTNNTSGRPGVYRRSTVKYKNGRSKRYWLWQAIGVINPNQTKSFLISRYGEDEAYRLAVLAREAFEAEIEGIDAKQQVVAYETARQHFINDEQLAAAKIQLLNGAGYTEVAQSLGITTTTLYRRIPASSLNATVTEQR